jgi:hypothetical protein
VAAKTGMSATIDASTQFDFSGGEIEHAVFRKGAGVSQAEFIKKFFRQYDFLTCQHSRFPTMSYYITIPIEGNASSIPTSKSRTQSRGDRRPYVLVPLRLIENPERFPLL